MAMTVHASAVFDCRSAGEPSAVVELSAWEDFLSALAAGGDSPLSRLDDYFEGYFFAGAEMIEVFRALKAASSLNPTAGQILGVAEYSLSKGLGLLFCCD